VSTLARNYFKAEQPMPTSTATPIDIGANKTGKGKGKNKGNGKGKDQSTSTAIVCNYCGIQEHKSTECRRNPANTQQAHNWN